MTYANGPESGLIDLAHLRWRASDWDQLDGFVQVAALLDLLAHLSKRWWSCPKNRCNGGTFPRDAGNSSWMDRWDGGGVPLRATTWGSCTGGQTLLLDLGKSAYVGRVQFQRDQEVCGLDHQVVLIDDTKQNHQPIHAYKTGVIYFVRLQHRGYLVLMDWYFHGILARTSALHDLGWIIN